ncbi:carbohydrate ABC transporter permease [Aureimonas flava]|nr:sugar ABC transporter permease [Aureimonas flava]
MTLAATDTMKQTDRPPATWTRCLDPGDRTLAALLLAPAALLLSLIIVYPVGRLLWMSLQNLSLTSGLPAEFVGLENYALMWDDPVFWDAAWNTLLIVAITVPGALLMGLGMALLANLPFRRRWPVRLSLLIPWALPLSFAGLIFAWSFHYEYGIVNDVLNRLGFEGIIWFNSPGWAFAAICLTIVWKTSSFMALIILAGLQTIPRSLYEAADVDGAGRMRQFFEITLPLLKPAIVIALIFRTITALQTFDIPYMMTGGGPGTSTVTLAMYIHQNTVSFLDLGYGSALAVVMFAFSMCVTFVYLRMLRRKG